MACRTCSKCPERLSGCDLVRCERCDKLLCNKKDVIVRVFDGMVVCEDCSFDLSECQDNT